MILDNLIRENSWLYCDKCSFYLKSEDGLRLHIVRIHDKDEPTETDLVSKQQCFLVWIQRAYYLEA